MLRRLSLIAALLSLAACSADPLADMPRLADVDVAGPAPVVEAVAAPAETDDKTGFFARILRKRDVASEDVATEAAPEVAEQPAVASGEPIAPTVVPETTTEAAPAKPGKRRFRLFGRKTAPAEAETEAGAEAVAEADATAPVEAKVETVALVQPEAAKPPARARKGLFSRSKAAKLTAPGSGPDARDMAAGEVLPFGEIARACHIKRSEMGKEVARHPERSPKYRVYDSAPGNLGLHTLYVTGFADGCPRQVTAALAVFGSAGMYEALRYALPVKARSKKPTDKAYEKVKAQRCGVSRTKPCGAKISRIEKGTVFLSLYNRFEGAQGWTNLLLSDGRVMARDVEG